jgi:hypothetical protein
MTTFIFGILAVVFFLVMVFAQAVFLDSYGKKFAPKFNQWLHKRDNMLIPILGSIPGLIIVYAFFTIHIPWEYSSGERSGKLMKVTKKGVFMKTYEGTLMVGMDRQWHFSIVDPTIYNELKEHQGEKVTLSYIEEYRVPPSMGATNYLISSVEID